MQETKEIITSTAGDTTGKIDNLILFLKGCKERGATHYHMRWSGDPQWAFKWFETYYKLSEEEIKQNKIKELEGKLEELKGSK